MPTLGSLYLERLDKPTCLLKLIQHPDIGVLCSILITMRMALSIMAAWVKLARKGYGSSHSQSLHKWLRSFFWIRNRPIWGWFCPIAMNIIEISCETPVASGIKWLKKWPGTFGSLCAQCSCSRAGLPHVTPVTGRKPWLLCDMWNQQGKITEKYLWTSPNFSELRVNIHCMPNSKSWFLMTTKVQLDSMQAFCVRSHKSQTDFSHN